MKPGRDTDRSKSLLVVAPTSSEYACVRAALRDLDVEGLEVIACGMGPAFATALCRRLDERTHFLQGLALIGWAGGLHPGLAPGDVVLADAALDGQGGRVPCTPVPGTAERLPGARVGALLTAPTVLSTPQAKRAAWQCGALAVEMEAYPLAAWAQAHDLPFVHARAILDAAGEAVPDLSGALDPLGRARPGRLARRLLLRPGLAITAARLMWRVRTLEPNLGRVARAVVQGWPEREGASR